MSNSPKRNVNSGAPKKAGPGRSNTTGPQVTKKAASAKERNKALADARKAANSRGGNQLTLWIVAAVVVAALVVAGIIAVNNSKSDKVKAVDLGAGTVAANSIRWGDELAPVTVDYYVDLLCPACRVYETNAAETVEKAVKDGTVKLVVHPVAILDQATKPAGYSTRAGAALLSAGDKKGGYLYMKELYDKQPPEGGAGLSDDELARIAADAGLGDDWKTAFESGEHKAAIKTNTEDFAAKGFKGTPTVLVNGTEMKTGTVDELKAAIDAAKKK